MIFFETFPLTEVLNVYYGLWYSGKSAYRNINGKKDLAKN